MLNQKPRRLFITGTDTDVGKTYISCALLNQLKAEGFSTLGLKPVASGAIATPEGLRCEDALLLQAASSIKLAYETINPIIFEAPIAPHLAAGSQVLSVARLLQDCAKALNTVADYQIIEGAGGWLTPLNEQESLADFAEALQAEIILVVGMRLGCINHALLTTQNIQDRGLKLAGWVANCIDPEMLKLEENIESLRLRIQAPLLSVVSFQGGQVSIQLSVIALRVS